MFCPLSPILTQNTPIAVIVVVAPTISTCTVDPSVQQRSADLLCLLHLLTTPDKVRLLNRLSRHANLLLVSSCHQMFALLEWINSMIKVNRVVNMSKTRK